MKNYKIEVVTDGLSDAHILIKMQQIVRLLKDNNINTADKLIVYDFDGNIVNPEFQEGFEP